MYEAEAADQLRHQCLEHMRQHEDQYGHYVEPRKDDQGDMIDEDFEAYLTRLATWCEHGDAACAAAASELLRCAFTAWVIKG